MDRDNKITKSSLGEKQKRMSVSEEDQDGDEDNKITKSSSGEKGKRKSEPESDKTIYSENVYRKKFMWPESYVNRESRKDSEPLEPIEPMDIGKKSVRPFFGQIVENLGLRLNSNEMKSWNLCFKVEKKVNQSKCDTFGYKVIKCINSEQTFKLIKNLNFLYNMCNFNLEKLIS